MNLDTEDDLKVYGCLNRGLSNGQNIDVTQRKEGFRLGKKKLAFELTTRIMGIVL